jgi:urease accessory protein
MSGFVGGLLHPFTVPAHALALLALGLLIGQQSGERLPIMPWAAFAAGVAGGLAAIALAFRQTVAADLLLATAAVTGLLLALARPLPILDCAPLAFVGGVALGLDSPPQAISIAVATTMLIGTAIGACLALALIAVGASYLTRTWQRIGMRIVGSWIAASAILVLALHFARGQLL